MLASAVLMGAVLAGACTTGDSPPEQASDPYAAPVTVDLRGVVVGLVGAGVLLQNHSPEALENVEIVLNPQAPNGGFRFRASRVAANTTNPYVTRVFRTHDGLSFDDASVEVEEFAVYADTPRGRGAWRGRYGPDGN